MLITTLRLDIAEPNTQNPRLKEQVNHAKLENWIQTQISQANTNNPIRPSLDSLDASIRSGSGYTDRTCSTALIAR